MQSPSTSRPTYEYADANPLKDWYAIIASLILVRHVDGRAASEVHMAPQ